MNDLYGPGDFCCECGCLPPACNCGSYDDECDKWDDGDNFIEPDEPDFDEGPYS